ncbi:MAG: DUF6395 domain-containing protein [Candidatus Poseidoniaceae archaeon]
MFRRVLMRRAYNAGKWESARHHASALLSKQKNRQLARSIIVRSYWNEGRFQEVVDCTTDWMDALSQSYREQAIGRLAVNGGQKRLTPMKEQRLERLRSEQPTPIDSVEWSINDMTENFSQEENRVWFRYPEGYVYWDMPDDYDLSLTHPALLGLTAEVLLSPWVPSSKDSVPTQRAMGERCSLSFSAGTDSTAAAAVLPESTLLGYHRRSFQSMLDHRNADRLITHFKESGDREVISIPSNHELIRTQFGKPVGFSSDFACASHLILLADHLGIGAIGFGMPLDNTFLWKGRKFRDFSTTHYFKYWTRRFSQAGLDLLFPIASISEAGALMVVKQTPWLPSLNSCMRGDGVTGCGRCWKCFHKNGPLGRSFDVNSKEIQTYLQRRPMPTATHALWALQTMGLEDQVPDLEHLFTGDLSWWGKVYPPAFELLPSRWENGITSAINSYLDEMEEPYLLEFVNHFDED